MAIDAAEMGFEHVGTDIDAILENPEINTVVLAAADNGDTLSAALRAGKRVLALAPVAAGRDGLDAIVRARNRGTGFLQVAHPRRFAPLVRQASEILSARPGARSVLIRAAAVPDGTPGFPELSDYVDLARFLAGAAIATVGAGAVTTAGGDWKDLTVTLRFADGSLATIVLTARDAAVPGEMVECHNAGAAIRIDDFLALTIVTDGVALPSIVTSNADRGHGALFDAFLRAVPAGGPAPVDETAQIETCLAAIAVFESLRTGAPITL